MFYQIIPVMIGVYLAFAVSNFAENRKVKNEKDVFTKMLYNEISANLKTVDRSLPYHLKLKGDFRTIARAEKSFEEIQKYTFQGLRPPRLNNGAYQTGVQTGILKDFDLEFVQQINRLYTLQESKVEFNNDILASMLATGFPKNDADARELASSTIINLNDILAGEIELQQMYCDILNGYMPDSKMEYDSICMKGLEKYYN